MHKTTTGQVQRRTAGAVPHRPPLEVSVACDEPLHGILVVRLCGDLDPDTVGPVRSALDEALA